MNIERFDQLRQYLTQTGRVSSDEALRITPLEGGVSNRTVWVERPTGEAWVLKQALPQLRVAVEWFSDPQRIHREALGLRALQVLLPGAAPALVFEDREELLLAMEAVPQPHENWKHRLLQGRVELPLIAQFAELLADLHGNSRRSAQRPRLAEDFADITFFRQLRLEPYYGFAAEQTPAAADFLHALIDQTTRIGDCLVHGDYSPKNVLVTERRLILLDHEVMHWGDPAFDLGFSLTHLLSKAHHLPASRDALTKAARLYWERYRERSGADRELERRAAEHTLACLLARVAGRSPLEYLDSQTRLAQGAAVCRLIASPPESIPQLIGDFLQQIAQPH